MKKTACCDCSVTESQYPGSWFYRSHNDLARSRVIVKHIKTVLPFGVIAEVYGCFPVDSLADKTVDPGV